MLTNLDFELFPQDCEVVEIPSHNLWVYLIQKNASSSLRVAAENRGWKIWQAPDLAQFEHIDIYLRDPVDRYVSGIMTFTHSLLHQHPGSDLRTLERLVTRYLFLNRHYLPQWHWLVNLARMIDHSCVLRLHDIAELRKIVPFGRRPDSVLPTESDRQRIIESSGNINLWLLMDEILLGRCGQSFTWQSLLDIYRQHPARPLDTITQTVFSTAHVLR